MLFSPAQALCRRESPFTSVTRWLLVVIGCAVLATAQPMSAAAADEKAPAASAIAPADPAAPKVEAPAASKEEILDYRRPREGGRVLQPAGDTGKTPLLLVLALLLAAGGAWVLIQRRQGGPLASRTEKRLQIAETRPLGNRQYLIVADYEGQRFLLGVTPGQIQLLTPLRQEPSPVPKP